MVMNSKEYYQRLALKNKTKNALFLPLTFIFVKSGSSPYLLPNMQSTKVTGWETTKYEKVLFELFKCTLVIQ